MDILTIIQIALVLIFIYLTIGTFKPVKGLQHLSKQEVEKKLKSKETHVLIDVRQPNEYKLKHIPNSINIPLSDLKKRKKDIPLNKKVILYCQTGIRSKQAARVIRKKHKDIELAHLKGGLFAWEELDKKTSKK